MSLRRTSCFRGEASFSLASQSLTNSSTASSELAARVAESVAGGCAEAPLIMGGEDFAFTLEQRPVAYILVGNGDTAPVHHPAYNFNDEAIPAGCSWWAGLAETAMPIR